MPIPTTTLALAGAVVAANVPTDATASAAAPTESLESRLMVHLLIQTALQKSFFETVPWDLVTGHLIERFGECERKTQSDVIGIDWPSDSQDPMIKKLSVVYSDSPSPRHATVRASFRSHSSKVVIDYDMYLYDEAPPPGRWGVSNIRIHNDRGTNDLLQTLRQALDGECKDF